MTTDTRPKVAEYRLEPMPSRHGQRRRMIHPNMATMLSVITTDALVSPELLDQSLRAAVAQSFKPHQRRWRHEHQRYAAGPGKRGSKYSVGTGSSQAEFTNALTQLAMDLAKQVARDGEWCDQVCPDRGDPGKRRGDAVRVGRPSPTHRWSRPHSTAGMPTGSRRLCAGYSGVAVDPNKMALWFGPVNVLRVALRPISMKRIQHAPSQDRKSRFGSTLGWDE